jgi:predicted dehydrogenase
MDQYKAAVIGCGKRGQANARAIGQQQKLDLVALVDPVAEAAEQAKAEQGTETTATYTDHREMLQRERPDLCVICVWTGLHLEIFRDCAEAGVTAVFMEKPVAGTWAECREIGEIADRTGCRLSISHQRRFHQGNMQARKMIADGLLGKIIRLDLFSPKGLLDCGTHSLDQAFSFLNDQPGVKWVHGAVDLSETFEAFAIPEAGMFTGTLMYDNGILGNIYCNVPGTDHPTGVKVFGTKGFMEFGWAGDINKFAIHDRPDFTPPEITEEKSDPMTRSIEDVISSLESDHENELHYRKALRAAETIFAFYQSAVTHRRVELPLPPDTTHPLKDLL